jgi:Predicted membrane protein (DUF2142)
MEKTRRTRERMGVRIALVAGLALLAAAVAVTLSHPSPVVAGTNGVAAEVNIATPRGATGGCQSDEALPGGTTAIRLWVTTNIGPRVSVTALSGSRVVTSGVREAGWTGDIVTVPVRRVPRAISHVRVCYEIGAAVEEIGLIGASLAARPNGEPAKMRIEYLRPGPRSWWSLASTIARRIGLGRSPSGTLIFAIPLALMTAATILASLLILRQLGRTQPTPAAPWICAAVACLSAASWSILTPPFQVPDEPSHFAYAQQLAETGRLPTGSGSDYSPDERAVMKGLLFQEVRFNPEIGTLSSTTQQRHLERTLALPLPRHGAGEANVASSEPPLYYALQTIPYHLAGAGNLLDQLTLMRLLSALMAAISALFVYLFLREALPGVPWAWTVGALGVALFPLLGFMSGAVNPDALLCAVSAAMFYLLARAFRHGLTPRLAIAIGAVTAIGFLTKLNFLALAPGIALALILLTRRAARTTGRRSAYRSLAIAAAIAASPIYVYVVVNLLSHHATLGVASSGIHLTAKHGSPGDELVYIWQLYLPRLPGMATDFPGIFPLRQLWFERSVGLYGWLDTAFPDWVYNVALIPAALIAALCARALVLDRAALRRRLPELAVYALIAAGVLALIGADAYLEFPGRSGSYSEPRYLLPLAALFGALMALAARGAGRRLGPAAGTLIVLAILAHDVFSQLLTVARYYA